MKAPIPLPRRRVARWCATALVGFAGYTQAQIGLDSAACHRLCGTPTAVRQDEDGIPTEIFQQGGQTAEFTYVGGIVHRAVYRAGTNLETQVEGLLKLNAEGCRWDPWRPSGRAPDAAESHAWMRSDKNAMATYDGSSLTVTGAGWNRRHELTAPAAASPTAPGATGAGNPPAPAAAPAVAPPSLAGCWQAPAVQGTVRAAELKPDGTVLWVAVAGRERHTFAARYRPEDSPHPRHADVVAEQDSDKVFGALELAENGTLSYQPLADARLPATAVGVMPGAATTFQRTDELPRWRPPAPTTGLPAKGDPKEKVLRLLGKPTGNLSTASREILLYPWGQVTLVDGQVLSVQQ